MATPKRSSTHVVMGRIAAPYGIKGWVKLISFTDPADNLLDYEHFWVADGADGPQRRIVVQRIDSDRYETARLDAVSIHRDIARRQPGHTRPGRAQPQRFEHRAA